MQLRFLDHERDLLTLDTAGDAEIPRRGEEVVLHEPLTGRLIIWGVVQVQRRYEQTAEGVRLLDVRVHVRPIEPAHLMPDPTEL